jgi:hypothetical protein
MVFDGLVFEATASAYTGTVDEDVDATELVVAGLDRSIPSLCARDVQVTEATVSLKVGGDFLTSGYIDIGEEDLRALGDVEA